MVVPTSYRLRPTEADLIIFFILESQDEGYHAYARPCLIQNMTKRTVVGLIAINLHHIYWGRENLENNVGLVIHEIIHILGFNQSVYKFFNKPLAFPNPFYVVLGDFEENEEVLREIDGNLFMITP